jgi:hypothetical protein
MGKKLLVLSFICYSEKLKGKEGNFRRATDARTCNHYCLYIDNKKNKENYSEVLRSLTFSTYMECVKRQWATTLLDSIYGTKFVII